MEHRFARIALLAQETQEMCPHGKAWGQRWRSRSGTDDRSTEAPRIPLLGALVSTVDRYSAAQSLTGASGAEAIRPNTPTVTCGTSRAQAATLTRFEREER